MKHQSKKRQCLENQSILSVQHLKLCTSYFKNGFDFNIVYYFSYDLTTFSEPTKPENLSKTIAAVFTIHCADPSPHACDGNVTENVDVSGLGTNKRTYAPFEHSNRNRS